MKRVDGKGNIEMLKQHFHFVSAVTLEEGSSTSSVEVLRVGTIQDRGLNISKGMLEDYVRNHKANVYGTELQVNFEHNRGGEAAGWFKDLYLDGDSLMGTIEWTELGADKIRKKIYKFISSELAPEYPRFDTGQPVSNVFIGAGLTNTPAMKGQKPLSLSEEEKSFIHLTSMFNKLIETLKAREKLTESDITLAKSLLAEVPEADKEQASKDVAALEDKQKEQAAAEVKAAEEAKKGQTLDEKGKTVTLAEFTALKEDNMKLREQVEMSALKEDATKTLILSEDVSTGFNEDCLDEVVKFMKSLSTEQRDAFKGLIAKVKYVDFTEHGGTNVATLTTTSDDEDQALADLAEDMMKKGVCKDIGSAQKMAAAEIAKKKKEKGTK